MAAYYNEHDKFAAAWLRELIKENLIAPGDVDERSIKEVQPEDLRGYTQCHFFGGIGGWSYALRLAGWTDDAPVWTGSCPCQPFSAAGKQKAQADDRHLWPDFFRLIAECRPNVVFGEQVEGAIRHGWLDGIQADLEGEAYAVGHCVLGAHSVGAPHIRQRLYWVADSAKSRLARAGGGSGNDGNREDQDAYRKFRIGEPSCGCENGRLADTEHAKRRAEHEVDGEACGRHRLGWSGAVGVPCRDGKTRRIEPGIKPLAHGIPARVVRLRGYGNAIVPQVAATFIQAYLECRA